MKTFIIGNDCSVKFSYFTNQLCPNEHRHGQLSKVKIREDADDDNGYFGNALKNTKVIITFNYSFQKRIIFEYWQILQKPNSNEQKM